MGDRPQVKPAVTLWMPKPGSASAASTVTGMANIWRSPLTSSSSAVPRWPSGPGTLPWVQKLGVKLYKGNIMVAGRKSPVSLYNPHIATMEADPTKAYNQDDAAGFIRLNALRLKVAAKVQRKG